MDHRNSIRELLVFTTCLILLESTESHSLQYLSTAVIGGTDFPEYSVVGLVDGQQFAYYDSNTRKMIPTMQLMERSKDVSHWNTETEIFQDEQEWSRSNLLTAVEHHNDSKGIHTWQWIYGCEIDNNGISTAYSRFGYDGNDYISLDLETGTFSKTYNRIHKWGREIAAHCKLYLERECPEELRKLVDYGRDFMEKKVRPEVSVFQKDSSSPVVCHATGFFPKEIMISWQKDGQVMYEDVEVRETLVNPDGTFQKKSILRVSPEKLDRHEYICVVQHISMENKMVLKLADGRTQKGLWVAISIGAAVVLCVIITGCALWKKKKMSRKQEKNSISFNSCASAEESSLF